jgi:hypothetical protein
MSGSLHQVDEVEPFIFFFLGIFPFFGTLTVPD